MKKIEASDQVEMYTFTSLKCCEKVLRDLSPKCKRGFRFRDDGVKLLPYPPSCSA